MPRHPRPAPRGSAARDSLPIDRRGFIGGIAASVIALPAAGQQAGSPPEKAAPALLRAAPLARQILPAPAPATPGLGFDGNASTPLLRARINQPFSARLENGLDAPTSLHWYGLHGFNGIDGVAGLTQKPLEPGGAFDIAFTPAHSGLHWFHPLARGRAAAQLAQGLAGALVVEEAEPQAADHEILVLLKDWRLGEDGAPADLAPDAADNARAGRLGGRLTVNNRPGPVVLKLPPRARVRLRAVNAANARIMPLRFLRVGAAAVIALDGQPTEPFDPLRKQVVLAPGSRFEVMIDLPAEAGRDCEVAVALGDGLPVLRLVAEGEALPPRPPVRGIAPNPLPAAIRLQHAERATLTISGGLPAPAAGAPPLSSEAVRARFADPARIWRLNEGKLGGFDGPPLMRVKSGAPCVIALVNASAWAQVLHVHGHHVRYLHPFDDGWEPYWIDTLILVPGQTIRVAFDAEAPGRWAIRSSVLEHFEGGVATWFEVT